MAVTLGTTLERLDMVVTPGTTLDMAVTLGTTLERLDMVVIPGTTHRKINDELYYVVIKVSIQRKRFYAVLYDHKNLFIITIQYTVMVQY